MIRLLQGVRSFLAWIRSRAFAVGMLSVAMACVVVFTAQRTNAVYIRDGEEVTLKFTVKQEQEVEDILSQYGIVTMAYDSVDFSGFSGKMAEINIERAYPVSITVDGATREIMILGLTVAELLEEQNITLGEEDMMNYPLSYFMEENDHLVIQRVTYTRRIEEEVIPYESDYRQTPLLRDGKVKTFVYGEDGLRKYQYIQRTVDGVVHEEELESVWVDTEPVTETGLVGARVPVSELDFDVPMEDGVPVNYSMIISNAVATGYSARYGAGTASGLRAKVGHVAVNPEIIPYGSKLYITSADGEFVYGYAIAADTGTGLMANVIDVDLFYETYYESCLNGRKYVDIYVLDE